MAKEIVIDFDEFGGAESLHFDEFALMDVLEGNVEVKRASSIVFNNDTKKWDVILAGYKAPIGSVAQAFPAYNVAIAFEIEWLQGCRKQDISPDSFYGYSLASLARKKVLELGLKADRA